MKTLQEQYNLIKEGKGHKGVFLKEAKRLFPNVVPNSATFNQTTKLLKQRSVINENIFPLIPSSGLNPFTTFDKFINEEAKATESKTTKEVEKEEIAGYDYKDPKNLNNQIFDQYLNGLRVEMEKDPKLTMDEAKEVVAKNLEKDSIFYTKNAAFKVDGLGYEEAKQQEEPKGKHKSSGYGDLKENKMKEFNTFKNFLNEDLEKKEIVSENVNSDDLKELLEEAVAGIPSIGNPFLDRPKSAYENKFESFINEEEKVNEGDTDAKRADDAKRLGKKGEENIFGAGVKKGEEVEASKMKKEEMKPKKEGKMKYSEVVKKAEKLGEMAKNRVQMEIYGKKKRELEETLGTINEDSNLSEFIDEGKKKELKSEIALYEKAYMAAEADYNTNQ
jgi:hypothetical protein